MSDTKDRVAAMRQRRKDKGIVEYNACIPDTDEAKERIKKYAAKLVKESEKSSQD
mgnify:CR=1 FL=1